MPTQPNNRSETIPGTRERTQQTANEAATAVPAELYPPRSLGLNQHLNILLRDCQPNPESDWGLGSTYERIMSA